MSGTQQALGTNATEGVASDATCEVVAGPHDTADSRATARVSFVSPAVLVVVSPSSEQRIAVDIVDLSPLGVQVVAVDDLLVGMTVRLQCELPGRPSPRHVDVQATVRWKKAVFAADMVLGRDCSCYGLRFEKQTPQEEEELLRTVFFIEVSARANLTADRPADVAPAHPGD